MSMFALGTPPKALWYLTRGSGVVTLLLFTLSMALGMLTSIGWTPKRLALAVPVALHRNVSMLSVAFLAIHIVTTVVDGYAPIRWVDSIVPFISAYHPITLGLGALAFDLLLALIITSALRAKISFSSWRLVHWFAYACWPIAVLHGFLIGTDRNERWMLLVDVACVALIGGLAVWRSLRRPPRVEGRLQPITAGPVASPPDRRMSGSRT